MALPFSGDMDAETEMRLSISSSLLHPPSRHSWSEQKRSAVSDWKETVIAVPITVDGVMNAYGKHLNKTDKKFDRCYERDGDSSSSLCLLTFCYAGWKYLDNSDEIYEGYELFVGEVKRSGDSRKSLLLHHFSILKYACHVPYILSSAKERRWI